MRLTLLAAVVAVLSAAGAALAQFDEPATSTKGIRFDKEKVERYKVGLIVRASGCSCQGVFATVPVPTDWPEQRVKIVDESISPSVRAIRYRTLPGGAKQMLIIIPQLAYGERAQALVTFEVRRQAILAPKDPSIFVLPEHLDPDTRRYLGPSPYIESTHTKIRAAAAEIIRDKESAWEKVEAIYDWVRDHVEYKRGKLKGALAAMEDGDGDCEELTSLFIALCRADKIPARTVWVPDHCYPEFYLEDDEGKGHWIPCQAAGDRAFGSMPEQRPVLQKGDNFRVPEHRKPQRYIAEFLKVKSVRGPGQPQVEFIREPIMVK